MTCQDWLELSAEEVTRLVSSDGVVAPESVILDAILLWWSESGLSEADQSVLNSLLGHVRFPLCPPSLLDSLESDVKYTLVIQSQAYKDYRASTSSQLVLANPLSKTARNRGNF